MTSSSPTPGPTGPIRPLTARQRQVAHLAGSGLTCPQIAATLTNDGHRISTGRVYNIVKEIADMLPNPNGMGPLRLVARWAARQAA